MGLKAGDISAAQFAEAIFAGASQAGQIWHHFLSWIQAYEAGHNVLLVFFEDLKRDLSRSVKRIAQFLNIPCGEAVLAKVLHHASFKYMAGEGRVHFDDHFVRGCVLSEIFVAEREEEEEEKEGEKEEKEEEGEKEGQERDLESEGDSRRHKRVSAFTVGKVRKGGGKVGGGRKELPRTIVERLERRWQEVLAGPTGCPDYASLRTKFGLQN